MIVLISVIPALAYLLFRPQRESFLSLLKGIGSALVALVFLFLLAGLREIFTFTSGRLLLAVLIEEGFKVGVFLIMTPAKQQNYVNSFGIGIGFAIVELLLFSQSLFFAPLLRMLVVTPLHVLTLLLFLFIKKRLHPPLRFSLAVLLSFSAQFTLHLAYNLIIRSLAS